MVTHPARLDRGLLPSAENALLVGSLPAGTGSRPATNTVPRDNRIARGLGLSQKRAPNLGLTLTNYSQLSHSFT